MINIKHLLCCLLSVTVMMSFSVTAFAADTVLSNSEFLDILSGYVYYTTDTDGYIDMQTFTPEQQKYYISKGEFFRQFVETEQTMISFDTNSGYFSFEYITEKSTGALDVYVDGECKVTKGAAALGSSGTYKYTLDGANHRIDVYLPRGGMKVRNFTYQSGCYVKPLKRVKAMFYGDSITYGYGHDRFSIDYVSRLSRLMNYEFVDYGVGGYWFEGGHVLPQSEFEPDVIFVAYGANDTSIMKGLEDRITAFMDNLRKLYPTQKVYVLTPIWACDSTVRIQNIQAVRDTVADLCSSAAYGDVTVINGLALVPNDASYFLDGVHPNVEGNRLYADNLAEYVAPVAKITDVSVDNAAGLISWSVSQDGKYSGAYVYRMKENGKFKRVADISDVMQYEFDKPGIYVVKCKNGDKYISEEDLIYAEPEDTLTLTVSEGKIDTASAKCRVTYKNNYPCFAKAVICVEVLDKDGRTVSSHFRSVGIDKNAEKSFLVSLGAKGAASIRVSAVDTRKSSNAVAKEVVFGK